MCQKICLIKLFNIIYNPLQILFLCILLVSFVHDVFAIMWYSKEWQRTAGLYYKHIWTISTDWGSKCRLRYSRTNTVFKTPRKEHTRSMLFSWSGRQRTCDALCVSGAHGRWYLLPSGDQTAHLPLSHKKTMEHRS